MPYEILRDFKGSQTGSTSEDFKAGTQADLSDYLVSCVDPAWIRRIVADKPNPEHEHQNAASPAPAAIRRKKSAPQPQGEQA